MTPLRRGRRLLLATLYGIPLTVLAAWPGVARGQELPPAWPEAETQGPEEVPRRAPTLPDTPPRALFERFGDPAEEAADGEEAEQGADATIFPILAAAPFDPDNGVRTEIALIVRDLRDSRAWLEARRQTQGLSDLGAAFYAPGAQKEALGLDLLAEMARLIELARPGGGGVRIRSLTDPGSTGESPLAAAIVGFTMEGDAGFQGLLPVEPGFLERVEAALASAEPPAWHGEVVDGELRIPVGEQQVIGRVGEDGWLRLAAVESMLIAPVMPDPEPFFTRRTRRWVEGCDQLLVVRGGGDASLALAAIVDQPLLSDVIADMRLLVLGWHYDGDKTVAARLLLDNPAFAGLRPRLRRAELDNHLLALWDGDVTRLLSLSVPPAVLDLFVPWAEAELAENGHELPEPLLAALRGLDGRVGVASFGSPGDWALAVQLQQELDASALLPALEKWAPTLLEEAKRAVAGLPQLERVDETPVLHARPDPEVEGLRVAAIGQSLVGVSNRPRLARLLEHAGSGRSGGAPAISRLLTPPVREVIETPAMIVGYAVLGDTGALWRWAGIALGALGDPWTAMVEEEPELALLDRVLARAPTLLALEGFNWSLLYDLALSADLDGSVLVVQLLASEI